MRAPYTDYEVDVKIEIAGKIKVRVHESDVEPDEPVEDAARRLAEDAAYDGEWARPTSGFDIVEMELDEATEVKPDE